jgi:hypothetical protein
MLDNEPSQMLCNRGLLSRDKTEPSLSSLRKKSETTTDHDVDLSVARIGSTFDRGPYITFPQ